ncbi:MAG: hypothetical protein C5B55_05485, partial [Blastocatellia bacterium]
MHLRLIGIPLVMLLMAPLAEAQDRVMPAVGGPGGGRFEARCPSGQMLGGFELRVGDDVDAIRPLCRTLAVNLVKIHVNVHRDLHDNLVPEHDEERVEYGVNGAAIAPTDWYGGGGGSVKFLTCPSNKPLVSAIYVEAEGVDTVIVNRITLLCEVVSGGVPTESRDRKFWENYPLENTIQGPNYNKTHPGGFQSQATETNGTSICPDSNNHATKAVGISGRSGRWLDAVGLICGDEKLPPTPVQAVGRTKAPPPQPGASPTPSLTICQAARMARARNSPAAAGLEAQCRAAGAAGEPPPVKAVERVKSTQTSDTSGQDRSICDVAKEARARNSPAAAGLEAQCQATRLNELASRGAEIANRDPMTIELRNRQSEGHVRRGFDIGMAAAEGQTQPGPGKEQIRDSLGPEGRVEKYQEQTGFDTAVDFSLER